MNYSESLELLARSYTYRQIQEQTGVPQSTISYVLRGERELPEKYRQSVTAAGYFQAYRELRNEGAGENSALIIAGESLSSIDDSLYTYEKVVESYAKNWLDRNKRSVFSEDEGVTIYYNLDKAMDKWRAIIQTWDVSTVDLVSASYESKYYSEGWVAPRL